MESDLRAFLGIEMAGHEVSGSDFREACLDRITHVKPFRAAGVEPATGWWRDEIWR
jgi:hypothetical protein